MDALLEEFNGLKKNSKTKNVTAQYSQTRQLHACISHFRTQHGLRVFLDTITLSRVLKYTATMTYVKLLKPRFLHLLLQ